MKHLMMSFVFALLAGGMAGAAHGEALLFSRNPAWALPLTALMFIGGGIVVWRFYAPS